MTATIPNLPSLYDPFSTEAKWQKFWEDNQVYKADPNKGGEPYCIVIPRPMSPAAYTWVTPLKVP